MNKRNKRIKKMNLISIKIIKQKKEIRYEKYENLIKKYAWIYHKRTGIDFDELISEGNLIFCQCIKKFYCQCAFSTFLTKHLKQYLKYYIQNEFRQQHLKNELLKFGKLYYNNNTNYKLFLSEEIRQIMDIIIKCPIELFEFFNQRKKKYYYKISSKNYNTYITKTALYDYLNKFLNWERNKILRVFEDIKLVLNEIN